MSRNLLRIVAVAFEQIAVPEHAVAALRVRMGDQPRLHRAVLQGERRLEQPWMPTTLAVRRNFERDQR